MRERIETFLWSRGLNPNYLGYLYIADIFEAALEGQSICRLSLNRVAEKRGVSRSSVYQSLNAALRQALPPLPLPCPQRERLYYKLHYLYEQFASTLDE